MAVLHSNENLAQLINPNTVYSICNEKITEIELSVTPCEHNFHRVCKTRWLTDLDSCPLCRRSCDTHSLKSFTEQDPNSQNDIFAAQGAIPKNDGGGRLTRSRAGNNISLDSTYNTNRGRGRGSNPNRTPQNNQSNVNHSFIQNVIQDSMRSYEDRFSRHVRDEVGRMVSESLDSYFRNLNISEHRTQNQTPNVNARGENNEQGTSRNSGRLTGDTMTCLLLWLQKLSQGGN
ncbi:PREDICTED: putative RING-H2 finger protein ATL37 [Rhagoletis zephyria]|uniref:putative RING-H2 finger protein ATL37 n=1 Tax=Rhagoletis zephyria TaxID=28612 RepID=UPI0008112226|nr:PREDICTED: putative RING-H2 finger protein ATL37 [Rhagoletis zephyria]